MDAVRRRLRTAIGVGVAVAALLAIASPGGASAPGRTELGTAAQDGGLPNAKVEIPKISQNGRYLIFHTAASNLVEDDTNGRNDVFVRDLFTGETERISQSRSGVQGNSESWYASMSADGRYVAYYTFANNLIDGMTTKSTQVIRHDRVTKENVLVSVSRDGEMGDYLGATTLEGTQFISADGRYVTFLSQAGNLLDDPLPQQVNRVYVKDLDTGEVDLVSVDHLGVASTDHAQDPSISADGRYVVFSTRQRLTETDTGGRRGLYVRDRELGTTELVSVNSAGEPADSDVWLPRMSDDGQVVVWSASRATNLAPRGQIGLFDATYVHDRRTGRTERASVGSDGRQTQRDAMRPWISGDGRYVAFWSEGVSPGSDGYGAGNVYVRDRVLGTTELGSWTAEGEPGPGLSQMPSLSADGSVLAWMHRGGTLVPGISHTTDAGYVRQRGPGIGVLGPVAVGVRDGRLLATGMARHAGAVLVSATSPQEGPGDSATGRLVGSELVYRTETDHQLLARLHIDDLPTRPTVAGAVRILADQPGLPGVVYGLALTVDGVPHEVRMSVGADIDEPAVPVLRCDPGCVRVADGSGSYGTAGDEAQLTFSMDDVGAEPGSEITGVRSFIGIGSALGGAVSELQTISVGAAAVPTARVDVALLPAQAVVPDAAYDQAAVLTAGTFYHQRRITDLPHGEYRVHVRACLAEECHTTASTAFRLGDTD